MYLNMKYYENICNCLRVIQQDINRKLKSANCWQRTSLTDYLESFRIRGVFPSKSVWNRIVKKRIRQYETVQWQNRISDADFSLFSRLHNVHKPHIFWYRSNENPQICYKSMMQMIAYLSNNLSQPMETVLRKTRESTGVNCRNVRRRIRCQ